MTPAFLVLRCFVLTLCFLSATDADADFWDVRTGLQHDRSGKKGDPEQKYFHESTFHPHYDGRFAQNELPGEERLDHLTALIQTFLSTMADIGAETWIMHGTLLGWWWNGKILPWDTDLDVQVSEETITYLARYYNMTEYRFHLAGIHEKDEPGRSYLLEVNPNYKNGTVKDYLNVIDARWIDTETGLFIDVSTVRPNRTAKAEGVKGALMCKDKHNYLEHDIFPLRPSLFEGLPVNVPYEYQYLLEEEYGAKSLSLTKYEHHTFNKTSKLWEPMPENEKPRGVGKRMHPPRRVSSGP